MEMLDIVNEEDVVIGTASKEEVYGRKSRHRIVHVLIFNSKGDLLLQKRSDSRAFMPGAWVTSAGGHVHAGESYKQAALRELKEEAGITADLELLEALSFCDTEGQNIPKFLRVYKAVHEGPFVPDPQEVESFAFVALKNLPNVLKNPRHVHPELAFVLDKCFGVRLEEQV